MQTIEKRTESMPPRVSDPRAPYHRALRSGRGTVRSGSRLEARATRRTHYRSSRWLSVLAGVCLLACSLALADSVWANEIWVPPAGKGLPKTTTGTWPISPTGKANFAFGVPDNMEKFVAARIVLLPGTRREDDDDGDDDNGHRGRHGRFDLKLSISQDAMLHNAITSSMLGVPLATTPGTLQEIDITSIFSGLFNAASPGMDYVSLSFKAKPAGDRQRAGAALHLRGADWSPRGAGTPGGRRSTGNPRPAPGLLATSP